VVFPITDAIREILFPLQGQHPEFVFTYVAVYGNKRLGRIRGQRYSLALSSEPPTHPSASSGASDRSSGI
jgi:hypothetical protein